MILRPAYSAIAQQAYTDVSTALDNAPLARYSILGALVRALSRCLDSVYGYIDYNNRQMAPWSSTGTNLAAWAALWGVIRLQPAAATGSASFVLNGAATIPLASTVIGPNSVTYTTTSAMIGNSAGTYSVPILAAQTGAVTNLAAGSALTLAGPIPNVVAAGSVVTLTGGSDAETDAHLQSRAQLARSSPPHGGAAADFAEWAEQVPVCTRAWVQQTPATPGAVVVYVMTDLETSNNGFPTGTNGVAALETRGTAATGDQLTVANYIWPLRPVCSFVTVVAPIPYPVTISITNTFPNTADNQAAVIAALQARLLAIGSPLGQTIQTSDLTAAISSVLTSYDLITPAATTTVALGSLPVIYANSVTFA